MQQELTKRASKLLNVLSSLTDKNLKYDVLIYASGMCRKTMHKALKELREKGYVADNGIKGKVNTFQLLH